MYMLIGLIRDVSEIVPVRTRALWERARLSVPELASAMLRQAPKP
jgi:hypothetical protein